MDRCKEPDQDCGTSSDESSSEKGDELLTNGEVPPELDQEFSLTSASPQELARLRETAASGHWLAPTGHWLAHRALGLLRELAASKGQPPAEEVNYLDLRAKFVRQAYAVARPACPPPLHSHGEELARAAMLLGRDVGRGEVSARLRESIDVLSVFSQGKADDVCQSAKRCLEASESADGQPRKRVAASPKAKREAGAKAKAKGKAKPQATVKARAKPTKAKARAKATKVRTLVQTPHRNSMKVVKSGPKIKKTATRAVAKKRAMKA